MRERVRGFYAFLALFNKINNIDKTEKTFLILSFSH